MFYLGNCLKVSPPTCATSAGQKLRNKEEIISLLVNSSLTPFPQVKVSPIFEAILSNSGSCREVKFIDFVSNMQQIIIVNNKLK